MARAVRLWEFVACDQSSRSGRKVETGVRSEIDCKVNEEMNLMPQHYEPSTSVQSKHTLTKRGENFIAAATPAMLGMAANAPYSIPVSNDEVATSSCLA